MNRELPEKSASFGFTPCQVMFRSFGVSVLLVGQVPPAADDLVPLAEGDDQPGEPEDLGVPLVFSQLIQFRWLSWKTVLLSPSAVRRISSP